MKLSIVIPSYNEEKTLEELVNQVLAVQFPQDITKELIIVNDGSKDNSWSIMQRLQQQHPEVKAIQNEKNMGKSQTVRHGIMESTGDFVVVQDADLEYIPNELIELMNLVFEKNLDVVYGNRFGKHNKIIYLQNYIGNKFLSLISNIFTYPRIRTMIPDMEVCYKLIRGDVAREVGASIVSTTTFGLEPEITAKLARYKKDGKHLKFGIVPITYNARSIEEGKKMHAFRDGWRALKEILRFNLF